MSLKPKSRGRLAQRIAFSLCTQRPRVWISAEIFSHNCLVCGQYWDRTQLVLKARDLQMQCCEGLSQALQKRPITQNLDPWVPHGSAKLWRRKASISGVRFFLGERKEKGQDYNPEPSDQQLTVSPLEPPTCSPHFQRHFSVVENFPGNDASYLFIFSKKSSFFHLIHQSSGGLFNWFIIPSPLSLSRGGFP